MVGRMPIARVAARPRPADEGEEHVDTGRRRRSPGGTALGAPTPACGTDPRPCRPRVGGETTQRSHDVSRALEYESLVAIVVVDRILGGRVVDRILGGR